MKLNWCNFLLLVVGRSSGFGIWSEAIETVIKKISFELVNRKLRLTTKPAAPTENPDLLLQLPRQHHHIFKTVFLTLFIEDFSKDDISSNRQFQSFVIETIPIPVAACA